MPYYKDTENNLHYLENSLYRNLLPAGSVEVVDENEINFLREPKPEQLWLAYQEEAKALLLACDSVANRCFKAGVSFPAEWQNFTLALRDIVRASTGDSNNPLPVMPDYPPNT